ncbi:hypothetical protein LT493_08960 [Streptomyces tricolor]|nr:hypothetical protein [Streptomyces tricolor]
MPGKLSQGEYGARVGVPRILRLLERHAVPAHVLHAGGVRPAAPRGGPGLRRRGPRGGPARLDPRTHHGAEYKHERDLAFRSADALERITGRRPVGIRTPSWDFSEHTLDITRELGLEYDSP